MTREQLLEIAKPILFNTPMVQAIQDGRKTQTRRVVKAKSPYSQNQLNERQNYRDEKEVAELAKGGIGASVGFWTPWNGYVTHKECAHQPGDILYVRETWQYFEGASGHGYAYKAGGGVHNDLEVWRPSIHMPKAATRIFLRVTDVRAERLQDITEADAISEGLRIGIGGQPYFSCRDAYVMLWDSLYSKRGFGCDTNPWVWVYSFEQVYTE